MEINTVVQGALETNCYILDDGKEALVVDPATDGKSLAESVKAKGLGLKGVLITHFHLDHIMGAVDFGSCPVFISRTDWEALEANGVIEGMARNFFGSGFASAKDCERLRSFFLGDNIVKIGEGYSIPFAGGEAIALSTPGHSAGSLCYHFVKEKAIITGDTLFRHGYGRVDLPFSSRRSLVESLERLSRLDRDVRVYPGHGESSVIAEEIDNGCLGRIGMREIV